LPDLRSSAPIFAKGTMPFRLRRSADPGHPRVQVWPWNRVPDVRFSWTRGAAKLIPEPRVPSLSTHPG
jgi:hypothetical protein